MARIIERPLDRERQGVMDLFEAHPIGPHPSLEKETVVHNPLPRRAGFTSLLCDWIARTSWQVPFQVYAVGATEAYRMHCMVYSAGGNLNNCAFIGGSYQTREPLVGIGLGVSIMWEIEEVEFEGRLETVGHERVTLITFPRPIEIESRVD